MAKEIDVVLFGAETSQDLRIDFPELAEHEDFKNLKVKEVKFCWLVGNRTSPLFELEDHDKIQQAVKICYPSYSKKEELQSIYDGDLPDELIAGIDAMKRFNPDVRLRSSLMQHYIFDELQFIITMKSREQIRLMDADDLKKHTDTLKSVEKEIPNIIKRIESSNGIKTFERGTKKRILVSINDGITSF